jgi:drug/metabolite transporter (DMT)-like permease
VPASTLALLAALASALSWAVMFSILKHLLPAFDPYWLTSIRYFGASAILGIWLLVAEGLRAFAPPRKFWLLAAIGTALVAGFNILVLNGLKYSVPEHGALFVALGPAIVTLITWARTGNAPHVANVATIVAAFAGVALVITKGSLATLAGGSVFGDALLALGVACFAIYTAYTPLFDDLSRLRLTALGMIYGTVVTLVVTAIATALGIAHPPHAVGASDWLGMLYMIVFAAILVFLFWNYAIATIGVQNTSLFLNAVPVIAFVIAVAQGAHFTWIEYGGATLTVAALVASNLMARGRVVRLNA